MYTVLIPHRVLKQLDKVPDTIQRKIAILVEELRDKGPFLHNWPNYSRLGPNRYHCHLNRNWVACWYWAKGTVTIEVYYVGSRQNAPY